MGNFMSGSDFPEHLDGLAPVATKSCWLGDFRTTGGTP